MKTITYNLLDSKDYTFDATKVQVVGGEASLSTPYTPSTIKLAENIEYDGFGVFSSLRIESTLATNTSIGFAISSSDSTLYFDGSSWQATIATFASIANANENLYKAFLGEIDFSPIFYLNTDGSNTPILSSFSFDYKQESYVSISGCDQYCKSIGYSSWEDLTNTEKRASILRGTFYIESLSFKGIKTSYKQDMQWPRRNVKYNGEWLDEDYIPTAIYNAIYEAAYLDSQNPGVLQPKLDRGNRLASLSIGGAISKSWFPDAPSEDSYTRILGFLKGLLASQDLIILRS